MENKINEVKKETYDIIKQNIANRQITTPKTNIKELRNWLDAYTTCQNDILDLLEKLEVYEVGK